MTKFHSLATSLIAATLMCVSQTASAQGWAGTVPPWRGPSAASRSTTPSNAAGPFNAYYPAYGSYPDPVERQFTAAPQNTAYGYGESAYNKYTRNANRHVTGYAGETLYYGGESFEQPQVVPPAEQVLPPGTPPPMQQVPGPMPGAPAPMMMPGPCAPSDPCAATNPCCPPCPASWQHRCGQRMGEILAKMRECCDKFCACIENCCPKPQPQPCCWTGYQAWWHAPQPSNCLVNECLPSGPQNADVGVPLDMELSSSGVEVSDGALSGSFETVEPGSETFEEGPSFIEYGRPTIEDSPAALPVASPSIMPQVSHTPATTTAAGRVEASGRVENETTEPAVSPSSAPSDVDDSAQPTFEIVPPARADAET